MEHDEQRDEVRRYEHERELRHRSRRDFPNESGDEARTQRPGAQSDHEIQYPQEIPDHELTAGRKGGLADEGKRHPRCGDADRDVAQPRGPREQARQDAVRMESEKA